MCYVILFYWLKSRSRLCYPLSFKIPPPFFLMRRPYGTGCLVKVGTLHLFLPLDPLDLLFCYVTKLGESDANCSLQIMHSEAFEVFVNLLCTDFFWQFSSMADRFEISRSISFSTITTLFTLTLFVFKTGNIENMHNNIKTHITKILF